MNTNMKVVVLDPVAVDVENALAHYFHLFSHPVELILWKLLKYWAIFSFIKHNFL